MDAGRRNRIPLIFQAGLLIFASFYWGICAKTGAPFVYHPDEPDLVGRAVNMIISGDLNPHWFHWPTLLTYLYAAVFKILCLFMDIPLKLGAYAILQGGNPNVFVL